MKQYTKILAFSAIFVASFALFAGSSHALNGTGFNPGRIIDDGVFTNKSSMTVSQIQLFLESKVAGGSCDTAGSRASTRWYTAASRYYTHAEWGALNGNSAPFVCLTTYRENPTTKQTNLGNPNLVIPGSQTAAEIIYNAGQQYNINPQVLLVLLQKEQSLITDDWPWSSQYSSATGAYCPDTAPCDAAQAGFGTQVREAARLFRYYMDTPWLYFIGNNYVLYNPNTACGGTNVYIENAATEALYHYTPYQPNAAALANLYGTGDSCSAYGNRNFWRMFNDWFNVYASVKNGMSISIVTQPYSTPAVGQQLSYVVSYKNNLPYSVTLDAVGVVGRAGSITTGANRDFGWQGPITLAAGASQQFTFTTTAQDTGSVHMWPAILYQGNYIQYNNWGSTIIGHSPNLTLSQPLTANATTVYAGQNVTFSAVLKNNEPYPVNYGAIGIPVKFYGSYSYDATWVGPGTIAAGAEVTLSGTRNIDKPGPFTYWVSNYFGGTYTTIGPVKNFTSIEPTPNFSVSGITFSNSAPVLGENLGASFTVTNNLPVGIDVDAVGAIGRLGTFNGANRDIGWQGPVHFNANETKTFTGYTRSIAEVGTHYYWIGVLYKGNFIQYNNWGSTIVSRAPSFSVSGITFSNTSPLLGENLSATSFTITNNLSTAVDVDAVGIVGRLGTFNGANRDLAWQGPVHFNANEVKTFTTGYTRLITDIGTHYYWIGIFNKGNFIQYNNWGSTIVSRAP